jgi:hypothetical protein
LDGHHHVRRHRHFLGTLFRLRKDANEYRKEMLVLLLSDKVASPPRDDVPRRRVGEGGYFGLAVQLDPLLDRKFRLWLLTRPSLVCKKSKSFLHIFQAVLAATRMQFQGLQGKLSESAVRDFYTLRGAIEARLWQREHNAEKVKCGCGPDHFSPF